MKKRTLKRQILSALIIFLMMFAVGCAEPDSGSKLPEDPGSITPPQVEIPQIPDGVPQADADLMIPAFYQGAKWRYEYTNHQTGVTYKIEADITEDEITISGSHAQNDIGAILYQIKHIGKITNRSIGDNDEYSLSWSFFDGNENGYDEYRYSLNLSKIEETDGTYNPDKINFSLSRAHYTYTSSGYSHSGSTSNRGIMKRVE